MQILYPQQAKLNMLGSFVDPHSLDKAGLPQKKNRGTNNVRLMLVAVEGADADVVFNLCDELLEVDGVCDG